MAIQLYITFVALQVDFELIEHFEVLISLGKKICAHELR